MTITAISGRSKKIAGGHQPVIRTKATIHVAPPEYHFAMRLVTLPFLPVILKGSFRVWYEREQCEGHLSEVLWSNFRVLLEYVLGKLV